MFRCQIFRCLDVQMLDIQMFRCQIFRFLDVRYLDFRCQIFRCQILYFKHKQFLKILKQQFSPQRGYIQIRSSAWLEHYTDNVGVSSSNLDGSTRYKLRSVSNGFLAQSSKLKAQSSKLIRGVSSVGQSIPTYSREGHQFEVLLAFQFFFILQYDLFGGLAQLARASALHAEGHRFDSDILHYFFGGFFRYYKIFR